MPYDHTIFHVPQEGDIQIIHNAAMPDRASDLSKLFDLLVQRDRQLFVDKKIVIVSGDYPQPPHNINDFDFKFSTVVPLHGDSPFHFFPTACSLAWVYIGVNDTQAVIREMLDNNRPILNKKIWWAGAAHHPQRQDYYNYSLQNQDICETFLSDNNEERKRKFLTMPDHDNYKYLMDMQGQGWSGRLKYLLASGRVVFMPDRPWVEHWHRKLIPWEHYVPVNADFSDLREKYNHLESNDTLYTNIAANAKQFTRDNILLDAQLTHIIESLKNSHV